MIGFKWAILARHVTGTHKHRIDHNYTSNENKYNFARVTFPTPLPEIKIFEKNIPRISVNVYSLKKMDYNPALKYDSFRVYPLKVNEEK
jgi:hypothetical protein